MGIVYLQSRCFRGGVEKKVHWGEKEERAGYFTTIRFRKKTGGKPPVQHVVEKTNEGE